MSLAKSKSDYSYDGTFEISSLEEIAEAERRLASKKQALEDMQNEYYLIEKQTYNTYLKNIAYFNLAQKGFIEKSKKWVSMLKSGKDNDGNKLDGRKKYDEKEIYEYYIGYVKDLLGIDSITNISFVSFNFGEAEEINFTYKNHNWRLYIPMIQSIGIKTYRNYGSHCFKLKIFHENRPNCWSLAGNTFEEEELKDIMNKAVEKYVKEQ